MTAAKVTQAQADAYMDGWHAGHNGVPIKTAYPVWRGMTDNDSNLLAQCFVDGYGDCLNGKLDFDKMMGPEDLCPEGP
jgi:hypothetical protein